MLNTPIISFCIPTYNRGSKVFKLVNNILKFQDNNIEVLVLDNCSTDNTEELLSQIKDSRLRFVINEKNVGGIKNPYKSMSMANGDFCFLCLDKDFVNPIYIGELINKLTENKDVIFGHSALNINDVDADVIFEKGFDSIYNMAYLSAHPTGMFYKTSIFNKTQALENIFKSDEIFGFYFELINAEMSLKGKSLVINSPAFLTESREESATTASFTYKDLNDVFFSPGKRFNEFYIYTKHLFSLNISFNEKKIIAKKIFAKSLLSATLGYKGFMKDESICRHYHLKPRNFSLAELVKIYFNFVSSFFKSDIPLLKLQKISLFLSVNLSVIYYIIGVKIGLNNGK